MTLLWAVPLGYLAPGLLWIGTRELAIRRRERRVVADELKWHEGFDRLLERYRIGVDR